MREQRKLFRITVTRDGMVHRGAECAPCAITEVTPDGLGLTTALPVSAGESLGIEFSLTGAIRIRATLLVTHRKSSNLGGRITAMDAEDRLRLNRFIDEHSAVSLFAC